MVILYPHASCASLSLVPVALEEVRKEGGVTGARRRPGKYRTLSAEGNKVFYANDSASCEGGEEWAADVA